MDLRLPEIGDLKGEFLTEGAVIGTAPRLRRRVLRVTGRAQVGTGFPLGGPFRAERGGF